jgi:hypothetical protein
MVEHTMITADTLKTLITFTAPALTRAAQDAGYRGPEFTGAKFVGITNGGQFCYTAVFHVKGGTDRTKVFLTYDPVEGRVIADYHLTELA